MAEIKRATLFGKLNSVGYKAIEGATIFCKMRDNPYVETAHWLHQLLQAPDSDIHRIFKHFQLDGSRFAADLIAALDRLPRGATAISDFSADIPSAIEHGWVYGTLMFGDLQVRTGHLVVGFLNSELRHKFIALSKELSKIKLETLTDNFGTIVAGSPEDSLRASDGTGLAAGAAPGETSGAIPPAELGKQEALKRFTTDLTEKARKGEIDPIIGRDEEIRQCVDILMRRRQNNPILTGEAGVGKTAVVEGFALRLARGDVPPQLQGVALLSLDIGLLQAGASMKGEFEQRLRQVIDEVQASPKPIILFVDEVHTLVGAGGAAGTGDAANLLKPALARGTLRTIGATTWAEYKKYIEKDPALTRRFQVVQVPEPDETKTILMLRGVASILEKHHRVQLLDEAIEAAVRLSHRYIPARQLPDKAVSLLDTSCARVAVSQHAIPAEVEDSRRRIEALDVELAIIGREESVGFDIGTRRVEAEQRLAAEHERLKGLEARWSEEKDLVDNILKLRSRLREGGAPVDAPAGAPAGAAGAGAAGAGAAGGGAAGGGAGGAAGAGAAKAGSAGAAVPAQSTAAAGAPAAAPPLTPEERAKLLDELHGLQEKLHALQGETPLIMPTVDGQAVSSVVSDWTGIPVGRMVKNEVEAVLKLADTLNSRVIGQRHGLEMIAKRIQTSRARLDNPNKPI